MPVVAVRRLSGSAELEVVRGYHPTAEWPGTAAPPGSQRHHIPAASFNPHPRPERTVGDEQFEYSTVAASICCRDCGNSDLGFGYVSSRAPLGSEELASADRTLCEACINKRAPARA
ncbi:MAG: hypothetical protein WCB85_10885 [Candidatus Dormiibacterota bacterium]